MKKIVVKSLTGIQPGFRRDIYNALKDCANKERIAVCLFLMSDLSNPELNHENIERNLRMIWPPSSKGKRPDDYADFSAIQRSMFDAEVTRAIPASERFWENVGHGLWRNTQRGNELAIRALARRGIEVVRRRD